MSAGRSAGILRRARYGPVAHSGASPVGRIIAVTTVPQSGRRFSTCFSTRLPVQRTRLFRSLCTAIFTLLLHGVVIGYLMFDTAIIAAPYSRQSGLKKSLQWVLVRPLSDPLQSGRKVIAPRHKTVFNPARAAANQTAWAGVTSRTIQLYPEFAVDRSKPRVPPQAEPATTISTVPAPPVAPAGTSGTVQWQADLDGVGGSTHHFEKKPNWMAQTPASSAQAENSAVATFGQTVGRSARPDCQSAYRGMGLVAIPVLLFNTVARTGCRWD